MTEKASPSLMMFNRLYKIKAFRYIFKFSVSLFIMKAGSDLFYYWLYGQHLKLPRYCEVVGAQHPLNPPLAMPYPFQNSVSQIYETRKHNKLSVDSKSETFSRLYRLRVMYPYHPWTEHSNQIDYFLKYTEQGRVLQPIYYRVLKKMQDRGVQIPDGISQSIRSLQQYKLNFHKLVVPQL